VPEDFPSLSSAASTSAPQPSSVQPSIAASLSLRHRPLEKVFSCEEGLRARVRVNVQNCGDTFVCSK